MKKKLALLLPLFLCNQLIADEISIRADEWFPMNGMPKSDNQGYMIDLATEIFAQYGHTVNYDVTPWQRAVAEVEQGLHDCVVGAYVEDAPNFTFPTESWGIVNTGVYVRADDPFVFKGKESLNDRKVGIISGYAYSSEEINQSISDSPDIYKAITGHDPLQSNIKKLQHERIDTIVENPAVMAAKLKELDITDEIRMAGRVGELSPIYIACTPDSKRAKDIVKMVDEGTKQLRASGKLAKIMTKYGLTDWQKQ